ncbi:MAG TPA: histidine phosphatase family protein [Anaerolineales bacterium]|nr:histidine phosphatase family protein [Anaerolineales bacterium]
MKIFFARHGESQANILHEISNRELKHPLTQKGREQASALGRKFQKESISRIYSSPVLRAIETTIILANQLCIEYEVTEALREYDLGELEGRSDEKTWERWQELFEDWTEHQLWEKRVPGGENFYDVQKRFVPFINGLIQEYHATAANLLCIGHGGLYWMMLPLVLKNVDTEFIRKHGAFEYAAFVVSELTPEGLMCSEWNGVQVSWLR